MTTNLCGLQAAESNRSVLRFLKESDDCWGVTPNTGASRQMRITKSSLTAKKTTVVSNELRADRMVPDVVEVAAMSGGDVDAEFSAGSLDPFLEAFLQGTWTRDMTYDSAEGVQVAWTATDEITVTGVDLTPYFAEDQRVKISGFLKANNNGYFQIDSIVFSTDTVITMSDATATIEGGSNSTRIEDANDVIILKDDTIRAGTASANTFDSNSGNAFADAITAGELVVGQKIFVQFADSGYDTGSITIGTKETGTIAFTSVADDGDTVTIDDGVNSAVVYTFGDGTGGTVDKGVSATTSAQNLKSAINAEDPGTLNVTAAGGATTLTLTNHNFVHGSITKSDMDNDYTVTTFSGLANNASDGDTITIFDGVDTVVFEWDSDNAFTRGHVGVTIGADEEESAVNLQEAIMRALWAQKFQVRASYNSNVVTVVNMREGFAGEGSIAENGTHTDAVDFAGGDDTTHGFFTVIGLTDDVITVAEEVGTDAGGMPVTIKGSHCRNPGDINAIRRQSFTLEQGYADVSQYMVFTGQRVGGFSLDVKAGEIVTSQITFQGKSTTTHGASVLGASPYVDRATSATPVMNATVNVGSIFKDGIESTIALQAITLKGEAALRNQSAVGSKFPAGIGVGRFNLTGKITAFFETLDLFDIFLNHEDMSLSFDFLDGNFNAYWFTVPKLKLTEDPIAPGGIDQDITDDASFVAVREPNLNTMFMVDRFSSILAV